MALLPATVDASCGRVGGVRVGVVEVELQFHKPFSCGVVFAVPDNFFSFFFFLDTFLTATFRRCNMLCWQLSHFMFLDFNGPFSGLAKQPQRRQAGRGGLREVRGTVECQKRGGQDHYDV